MKKQAYIVDVYSYGNYHEVINQGYLMMISELYENVTYVAEKTSCENLRGLLDACSFDYTNVVFQEKKISRLNLKWTGLNYLLWLLKVSFFNYIYFLKTPKETDVFFNNNLFFAIWLIQKFHFGNRNRIFDLCHNEMEIIDPVMRKTRLELLLGSFLDRVFKQKKLSNQIYFLLLSPRMQDYFNGFVREENKNMIGWIDHCYIRPSNEIKKQFSIMGFSIKIGIPGAINLSRGLPQLKRILDYVKNERLKIYATSFVDGIKDSEQFECLNKTGSLLPFDIYNSYIQQMDALILFYKPGSYKLTASGAVLEAIWNQKPIFALKNAYFEYLFETYGALGKLFDNEFELAQYLNNFDKSSFILFKSALEDAKKALLPTNVKPQLLNVIQSYL